MVYSVDHERNFGVVANNDRKKTREDWLDPSNVTHDLEETNGVPRLIIGYRIKRKPFYVQTVFT